LGYVIGEKCYRTSYFSEINCLSEIAGVSIIRWIAHDQHFAVTNAFDHYCKTEEYKPEI
jgi:hypothetical protein